MAKKLTHKQRVEWIVSRIKAVDWCHKKKYKVPIYDSGTGESFRAIELSFHKTDGGCSFISLDSEEANVILFLIERTYLALFDKKFDEAEEICGRLVSFLEKR